MTSGTLAAATTTLSSCRVVWSMCDIEMSRKIVHLRSLCWKGQLWKMAFLDECDQGNHPKCFRTWIFLLLAPNPHMTRCQVDIFDLPSVENTSGASPCSWQQCVTEWHSVFLCWAEQACSRAWGVEHLEERKHFWFPIRQEEGPFPWVTRYAHQGEEREATSVYQCIREQTENCLRGQCHSHQPLQ